MNKTRPQLGYVYKVASAFIHLISLPTPLPSRNNNKKNIIIIIKMLNSINRMKTRPKKSMTTVKMRGKEYPSKWAIIFHHNFLFHLFYNIKKDFFFFLALNAALFEGKYSLRIYLNNTLGSALSCHPFSSIIYFHFQSYCHFVTCEDRKFLFMKFWMGCQGVLGRQIIEGFDIFPCSFERKSFLI